MTEKQKDFQRRQYEDAKVAHKALIKAYPFTTNDLNGEEWRAINENYCVSNYGRVKSFKMGFPKILKPLISRRGYLTVDLFISGKIKRNLIHRLVANAFIPNPDDKPQVNHIDGHKFNNYVDNLEWSTNKENHLHAVQNGLRKLGEENYLASLTNEQAKQIREMYIPRDKTFGGKALADLFGVTPQVISYIVRGIHYKNV